MVMTVRAMVTGTIGKVRVPVGPRTVSEYKGCKGEERRGCGRSAEVVLRIAHQWNWARQSGEDLKSENTMRHQRSREVEKLNDYNIVPYVYLSSSKTFPWYHDF